MKICVAQTRAAKGDIQKNVEQHIKLINLAASAGADMIIFPELSLTGYEPKLAKQLATTPDDPQFDVFQEISDAKKIKIGVGMPAKTEEGICISMLLFQPHQIRLTYSKKYLHADEEPFFVSGQNFTNIKIFNTSIALAICYELSMPEHAKAAAESGAEIYIASVAKSVSGISKAFERLSDIARQYSMTVLMSNCVGEADGEECAGKTTVWNKEGELLGQLNNTDEGILIFDTDVQETFEKII
jgi:predicted amidohydrolase